MSSHIAGCPRPLPPCHAPGVCPGRWAGRQVGGWPSRGLGPGLAGATLSCLQRAAPDRQTPPPRGTQARGVGGALGPETGVGRCHTATSLRQAGHQGTLSCGVLCTRGGPPSSAPHGRGQLASCGLCATFCTYLTSNNQFQNPVPVGDFFQRPLCSLKKQEAISF